MTAIHKGLLRSCLVVALLGMAPTAARPQAVPAGDGTLHVSNTTRIDVTCDVYQNGKSTDRRVIIKSASAYRSPERIDKAFGLSCKGVGDGQIFDGFSPGARYAIVRLDGSLSLVEVRAAFSHPADKDQTGP